MSANTVVYLDQWEFGGGYTVFWGGEGTSARPISPAEAGQRLGGLTNNLVNDRDFLSAFLRYTF